MQEEFMDWKGIVEKSCQKESLLESEAMAVLNCSDDSLLALLDAAFQVRKKFFGKKVKLNFLLNAKSGLCPEDCFYCSQSKISKAKISQYPFLSEKEILSAAERAISVKAKRFCMVNSGRGPTDGEIAQIAEAVKKVKSAFPQLEVCVCLGLLKESQAKKLKLCGVDAYNHNLNTSESFYSEICSTHTFQDRLKTVGIVKEAGLSSCSGCLFGMGEKDKDIIELAFVLRKIGAESIPINFLMPIQGTPLENQSRLSPQKCLKILCLFRFTNPDAEIRIAGGREFHLRWLQPFGLYVANSIFIGDYLTTKGQKPEMDLAMILDLGFEIEGENSERFDEKNGAAVLPEQFAIQLK